MHVDLKIWQILPSGPSAVWNKNEKQNISLEIPAQWYSAMIKLNKEEQDY